MDLRPEIWLTPKFQKTEEIAVLGDLQKDAGAELHALLNLVAATGEGGLFQLAFLFGVVGAVYGEVDPGEEQAGEEQKKEIPADHPPE